MGFFIYLLILKSFFLPLFIIPTGSMAQTLYGAHAIHTCANCGLEYPVGWQPQLVPHVGSYQPVVQCPNCRWRGYYGDPRLLDSRRPQPDGILSRPLRSNAGDRIFVHGWLYDHPLSGLDKFGPARWDVVVFKVPTDGETNYIKRLIGLPGEQIELINGDVFVNDRIASKTPDAQRSLWFPYYDQDFPPLRPSRQANYHPRWVPLTSDRAWSGLDQRVVRVNAGGEEPAVIQFATHPANGRQPGIIQDVYAYNEPRPQMSWNTVADVRLSAEIEVAQLEPAGYVELRILRGGDEFAARLGGDAGLELQHARSGDPRRETWGRGALVCRDDPVHVALCHVDGVVAVEVNGRRVLQSKPEQYEITPEMARAAARSPDGPVLQVAALRAQAAFRHLLIERDVYYTSDLTGTGGVAYGVQGRPITLQAGEYFMLGDNSPNSQDGRYAFAGPNVDPVGPHLKEAAGRPERQGRFHIGTVPGDQLIGRAFFVYWPGFMSLTDRGPELLPDLGRARWIR